MKRWDRWILLGALFSPSVLAQAPDRSALVVDYQHKMFYAEPGVTAAYSLEPAIAQAAAVPGGFQIAGISPGQTDVIVVTPRGARSVLVTVMGPSSSGNASSSNNGPSDTSSFGQYLFSYNNNPTQITNISDLTQLSGDRKIHIQITNANIFPAQGEAPVGFPVLSYEISRPGKSITFLDQMMHNSDLTMDGVLLRGLHVTRGPWEFHAGITSITEFQDFLLPSNRYEVGGISRHFMLSKTSSLEGNLYYVSTNTRVNAGATTGPLATVLYKYAKDQSLKINAELGAGNGFAFSGAVDWSIKDQELHADLRYESPKIATLGINQLHGRVGDLNWTARFGKRFSAQAFASDTSVNLPTEQQQISSATLTPTYWLTPHLGVTGGLILSSFSSQIPVSVPVQSHGFIIGPQLVWKRFGGSYQFQRLQNSGNLPASINQAYTAQASIRGVSVSGYYDQQTETPVFAPVQSGNPGLQEYLGHASQEAITPSQMGTFLRQDSSLYSQGDAQPVTLGLATLRTQYGATANFANSRAGRFSLTGLVNDSTGGNIPSMKLTSAGVTWTRQLGSANLLNTGVSYFRTTSQGQSTTEPVIQVSLQHQLYSVSRWLTPGRHGKIEGHVFVDSQYSQAFAPNDTPLAGVIVRLDKHRSTRTDKNGYYSFRGVPFGSHNVEVDYRNPRPFYLTSSSPKNIGVGETADFGISFARGRLFGQVVNDAAAGLPVTVTVNGAGITREIETEDDGKFNLDGLPDGDYKVHVVDVSLPAGYFAGGLRDSDVNVSAEHAGKLKIVLPAQRSIAGRLELYDPVAGHSIPLANARVTLDPTGEVSTTDASGRYLFRHLPPGKWTIACQYEGHPYSRTVSLAANPDIETGINFTIPLTGLASAPQPTPANQGGGSAEPSDIRFQNHNAGPRRKKK